MYTIARKVVGAVLFLPVTIVLTLAGGLGTLALWVLRRDDHGRFAHRCNALWGRILTRASGVRVRVTGHRHLESPGAILVCNHASSADIPILLGYLPSDFRFIAKRSLFKFLPAMAFARYIPVDRDRRGNDWERVRSSGVGLLRRGASLLFFVEGTRSRDGRLLPFRDGAFNLAVERGAPLIPVLLRNTARIIPAGAALPFPGEVDIVVLPPLEVNLEVDHPAEHLKNVTRESMEIHLRDNLQSVDGLPPGPIAKAPPQGGQPTNAPKAGSVAGGDRAVSSNRVKLPIRGDTADPTQLAHVYRLLPHVRAIVIDLDKCLVRGYTGVDVLFRLVFTGRSSFLALIAWIAATLRFRWSQSSYSRWLPTWLHVDRFSHQRRTLHLELTTTKEALEDEVTKLLPRVATRMRSDLARLAAHATGAGLVVLIASANSATFVEPIARVVGAQKVVCSYIDRLTREVRLAVGDRKLEMVLSMLRAHGIPTAETLAIADLDWSRNDVPLLETMGYSVEVVNLPAGYGATHTSTES